MKNIVYLLCMVVLCSCSDGDDSPTSTEDTMNSSSGVESSLSSSSNTGSESSNVFSLPEKYADFEQSLHKIQDFQKNYSQILFPNSEVGLYKMLASNSENIEVVRLENTWQADASHILMHTLFILNFTDTIDYTWQNFKSDTLDSFSEEIQNISENVFQVETFISKSSRFEAEFKNFIVDGEIPFHDDTSTELYDGDLITFTDNSVYDPSDYGMSKSAIWSKQFNVIRKGSIKFYSYNEDESVDTTTVSFSQNVTPYYLFGDSQIDNIFMKVPENSIYYLTIDGVEYENIIETEFFSPINIAVPIPPSKGFAILDGLDTLFLETNVEMEFSYRMSSGE